MKMKFFDGVKVYKSWHVIPYITLDIISQLVGSQAQSSQIKYYRIFPHSNLGAYWK